MLKKLHESKSRNKNTTQKNIFKHELFQNNKNNFYKNQKKYKPIPKSKMLKNSQKKVINHLLKNFGNSKIIFKLKEFMKKIN